MFTKVISKLNDIDKNAWDALVDPSDIQMSYNYMKSIEDSVINDYRNYYILVYASEAELVAAMPVFITDSFYLDTPLVGTTKNLCSIIRNYLPCFLKQRVLFCGCCISEYNKINMKKDIDLKNMVALTLKEVEDIAKREKIKLIMFKDFIHYAEDFHSAMEEHSYFKAYSLPGTYIDLSWNSFEEYVQNLKIRYRQNIRNKINQYKKQGGIEFEIVEEIQDIVDDIYVLYENTFNKAPVKFEKLKKDFFINIKRNLGDSARVIIARYGEKIVGFSLIICSQDVCINVRTGLDYEYASKYHLYFILHYKNIEYAIQKGMKRLYLSQTSYRPKLEMGSKLVPLLLYSKHRNPLMNKVYKILFEKLFDKYDKLSNSTDPHEDLKTLFSNYFSGKAGNKSA